MTVLLKSNPDHQNLPEIKPGDYVLLEKKDWVQYTLEAMVTNVDYETSSYTCKITNIFDKQTATSITGGDVLDLMNKNIVVEREYIQNKR